ncbi:UNVERIFIED_CONTAM: hypothetical protein C7383_106159 [Murimonas intestini]|uniref:Uncharacterized protein n=1 Tax=Murimonas intestini TaxID=1337051 RepID=A0AB73T481_9FIRM
MKNTSKLYAASAAGLLSNRIAFKKLEIQRTFCLPV